jgi:hypothetical protein
MRAFPTNELAIVKTFPRVFFREVTPRQFVRDFIGMNDHDGWIWAVPMSTLPKQQVCHCFIVIDNHVKYRAQVVDFVPGYEVTIRGTTIHPKYWMILTAPVVRAPRKIQYRGFQGFRYTEMLF